MAGNKKLARITIQLKRKIGVSMSNIHREVFILTLKQPKTQEPIPITSQSHKTSMVESTCTTVLRNSANVY